MANRARARARRRILEEVRQGDMAFGADMIALLIDCQAGGRLAESEAVLDAVATIGAALELAEEAGRRAATRACVGAMLDTAKDARRLGQQSKSVQGKVACATLATAMRSCALEVARHRGGRESALAEATPAPQPCPN